VNNEHNDILERKKLPESNFRLIVAGENGYSLTAKLSSLGTFMSYSILHNGHWIANLGTINNYNKIKKYWVVNVEPYMRAQVQFSTMIHKTKLQSQKAAESLIESVFYQYAASH